MPRRSHASEVDWESALGADRVVTLEVSGLATPIDWLALREEIARRIRPAGGRPTDRTWTLERQVPFREETWRALQELSSEIRTHGESASPAQLAALLVERGIAALKKSRR